MTADTATEVKGTEFTIPEGCAVCSGDIQIRVTLGSGALGICLGCKSFSRPQVSMTHRGLKISYAPAAEA